MHRSSHSWTTTMQQGDHGDSHLFYSPQGVHFSDGNNNKVVNITKEAADGSPHCSPTDQFPISCDECGYKKPGMIIRWCETCYSAICDACILDRHADGHSIVWYQEAVRIADAKYEDALQKATFQLKELNVENFRARRFNLEIMAKMNEMKGKVCNAEKDSRQMGSCIRDWWKQTAKSFGHLVDAENVQNRHRAAASSKSMTESLLERQAALTTQLKQVGQMVDHMRAVVDQEEDERD